MGRHPDSARTRLLVVALATLVVAGTSLDARAQSCEQPACTFTVPPGEGITQNSYPLAVTVSPTTCGYSYWIDCGDGSPAAWNAWSNATCAYPAVGSTAAATHQWRLKVGNASKTYCESYGSIKVYDCQIAIGQPVVPATAEVGQPLAFSVQATATHCRGGPYYTWDVSGFDYCRSASCPFTFTTAGSFPWQVGVFAQWGDRPTSFLPQPPYLVKGTITITAKDLQVGSITFRAGSITKVGDEHTLKGNVTANGVLLLAGDVTFRGTPSTGRGTLYTTGPLSVATNPPATLLSGSQTLLVDGTTTPGTLRLPADAPPAPLGFQLGKVPLYLLDGEIRVGSAVGISPFFYVGRRDGLHLAALQPKLALAPGSRKQLVNWGDAAFGDSVPGIHVAEECVVSYDAATDTLGGQLEVSFPELAITRNGLPASLLVDLVVEDGCVDALELQTATGPYEVTPGGAGRTHLALSDASIASICQPSLFAPLLVGDWCLREGECAPLGAAGSVWLFQPPRTLALLRGTGSFLGAPLLGPSGTLQWAGGLDALLLAGTWGSGGLPGGQDVLEGSLRAAVGRAAGDDTWEAVGRLAGTFRLDAACACPPGDERCRLARLALLELYRSTGGVLSDRSFTLRLGATRAFYDGRLHGRGVLDGLSSLEVMVRRFDFQSLGSGVQCFLGSNLTGRPTSRPAALLPSAVGSERTVNLSGTEEVTLLGVAGPAGSSPAIYLVTPQGQRVTPATLAQLPGAWAASDTASGLAVIGVRSATAGTWVVGEGTLPEGSVTFTVLAPQPRPAVAFTRVEAGSGGVAIALSVTPPAATTTVDLGFARTQDGLPEGVIASDLAATSGTVTATWDTAGLASGSYFVVATTDDGANAPFTTTHDQPVTVESGGLAPPTGLRATRDGRAVTLTWTPSPSPSVAGYNVLYTDVAAAPGFPYSAAAPLGDRATVPGLSLRTAFRFAVAGYDAAGAWSLPSTSVVVGPAPGQARRRLRDECTTYGRQGEPAFTDVTSLACPIREVVAAGLMAGCGEGLFCPGEKVTRAEVAVALVNARNLGRQVKLPAATGCFADVPADRPDACFVEQLTRDGISSGCGGTPPRFCPDAAVTRETAAILLLRAKYGAAYAPPPCTGMFTDEPCTRAAAGFVEQLARECVTSGCASSPPQFCPATEITRAQLAVFLWRMFLLSQACGVPIC